jgi:hypothetical protein
VRILAFGLAFGLGVGAWRHGAPLADSQRAVLFVFFALGWWFAYRAGRRRPVAAGAVAVATATATSLAQAASTVHVNVTIPERLSAADARVWQSSVAFPADVPVVVDPLELAGELADELDPVEVLFALDEGQGGGASEAADRVGLRRGRSA